MWRMPGQFSWRLISFRNCCSIDAFSIAPLRASSCICIRFTINLLLHHVTSLLLLFVLVTMVSSSSGSFWGCYEAQKQDHGSSRSRSISSYSHSCCCYFLFYLLLPLAFWGYYTITTIRNPHNSSSLVAAETLSKPPGR